MTLLKRAPFVLAAVMVLLSYTACPDKKSGGSSSAVVTVKVKNTDCAVKDLKIKASVQEDDSGGARHLKITVTATCNGNPVPDAELTATLAGTPLTTSLKTNVSGVGSVDVANPGNTSVIGQQVEMFVTGEDNNKYTQGSVTVEKAP